MFSIYYQEVSDHGLPQVPFWCSSQQHLLFSDPSIVTLLCDISLSLWHVFLDPFPQTYHINDIFSCLRCNPVSVGPLFVIMRPKTDLVTHISRSRYSYRVSVEAHFGRFPVFSLFVTKSPIFYFIGGLAFHSLLVLSNKNNNHVSYFVIISKRINLNPVIFPHPLFQLLSKKSPPRRVMVTKGNLVER